MDMTTNNKGNKNKNNMNKGNVNNQNVGDKNVIKISNDGVVRNGFTVHKEDNTKVVIPPTDAKLDIGKNFGTVKVDADKIDTDKVADVKVDTDKVADVKVSDKVEDAKVDDVKVDDAKVDDDSDKIDADADDKVADDKVDDKVADDKVADDKVDADNEDDKDEEDDKEKKDEEVRLARTTRIEKSKMDKTFKFLHKNRDKLKFDLTIQRNEVWTLEQKSKLIDSILYGYPVPPVMVMESEDGLFWFLDGKQRGTAVLGFTSDEWALSKHTKPLFGIELANKKFSELPEEMQDFIYDETITLIKLKHLSPEERDEMFVRWNSGTVLSKIELSRAKYSALISQINALAELEFFKEDIAMTATGRNRFQDQEIIMQIAMLLDKGRNDIKGFGSKDLDDYIMEMKKEDKLLDKELVKKIEKISAYMSMVSSNFTPAQKKKILKKANTPIVFNQAIQAMEEKVMPSVYAEFLVDFLDTNYDKDSDYGRTLQSSVSKRDSVVVRIYEIELHYNEFIEEISKKREKGQIYIASNRRTTAK